MRKSNIVSIVINFFSWSYELLNLKKKEKIDLEWKRRYIHVKSLNIRLLSAANVTEKEEEKRIVTA